jgi:chemotaxis protein MotB
VTDRHSRRPKVSHERWLVSYADFITLLFAFFVVLYAFAKEDQKKQTEISGAIDSGFQSLGIFNTLQRRQKDYTTKPQEARSSLVSPLDPTGEEIRTLAQVKSDFDQIHRQLQGALSDQIARGAISIEMGRDGLVISLREAGFFDSGSATPRPETIETLRTIAKSISHTPFDVRVEGHTDNVPVHNAEFDSNWELSSARATRIARLCIELHAVSPERLSAAGYAEFHPMASNDTPAGRAENRRVDLVVMPRTTSSIAVAHSAGSGNDWHKISNE